MADWADIAGEVAARKLTAVIKGRVDFWSEACGEEEATEIIASALRAERAAERKRWTDALERYRLDDPNALNITPGMLARHNMAGELLAAIRNQKDTI